MATVVAVIGGFLLLLAGGESLVRGSVALARRLGVSDLLIGFSLVAFGTSAPELIVAVRSAVAGSPDIAVGNVVGSNIANVGLVLGLSALVVPLTVDRNDLRPDANALAATLVAFGAFALTGGVTRLQGVVLAVALLVHLGLAYRRELSAGKTVSDWRSEEARGYRLVAHPVVSAALVVVGLVALSRGSRLLIDGAVALASSLGVPELVIGATVVAVGTVLPELVASLSSAIGGHPDVAVGNVLGSNLFNLLAVLGITAMVSPLTISTEVATLGLAMVILSLGVIGMLRSRGTIGRGLGALLLGSYVVYLWAVL